MRAVSGTDAFAASGTDARAVAEARRWFRELGHTPVERDGVTVVATPEHPDTWEANFATARHGATAENLLHALDHAMSHTCWRIVVVDHLTPPDIEAALPIAGMAQQFQLGEMIAREPVASPHGPATLELRAVDGLATRAAYAALAVADHREGDQTGTIDDAVSAGLLSMAQRRAPPCRHWLIVEDGEAVGYGSTAACPNGLGLIEDLFVRPDHRRRGLMSAFIVAATERMRQEGCSAVFLDAHAHAPPRRLYAGLGFAPVAATRTWTRRHASRT